jgi:hypothetical protein
VKREKGKVEKRENERDARLGFFCFRFDHFFVASSFFRTLLLLFLLLLPLLLLWVSLTGSLKRREKERREKREKRKRDWNGKKNQRFIFKKKSKPPLFPFLLLLAPTPRFLCSFSNHDDDGEEEDTLHSQKRSRGGDD